MILIADSGSSKTDWALINPDLPVTEFQTEGLNPFFTSDERFLTILSENLLIDGPVSQVFFYGAGCAQDQQIHRLQGIFKSHFGDNTQVNIESDVLAAARSCSGQKEAIISILGTGSNSCYYNGKSIIKRSPSLGFILGDEGSGSHIGKLLIKARYENKIEDEVAQDLDEIGSLEDHLKEIYQGDMPNRYLASFARIAINHSDKTSIQKLIEESINGFFDSQLEMYQDLKSLPHCFVGSIAKMNEDLIQQICKERGLNFSKTIQRPLDGLITFHSSEK